MDDAHLRRTEEFVTFSAKRVYDESGNCIMVMKLENDYDEIKMRLDSDMLQELIALCMDVANDC